MAKPKKKRVRSYTPKCPRCGGKLEDTGGYAWDCPNDCYPMALELWRMA